uniref:Reverse transcriptase domain-containing protein n=1 Tax=Trichobilharzia regenti TaxID=157069 RepID=A0AA85JEK2_TRIRE|nr:unnamed protein product [Trichobilharzia regenti]
MNLVQQLYDDTIYQVVYKTKLSEAFEVKTGESQGCLLSPLIFLIVVNWIIQGTVGNKKTDIRWTDEKASRDYLCLTSHKLEHVHGKTNRLVEEAVRTRLQVNIEKTKVKIPNYQLRTSITINQHQ